MGFAVSDTLDKYIDYNKLIGIKDFTLLVKVAEHLENIILNTDILEIFHLCTIVYTQEDLDSLV